MNSFYMHQLQKKHYTLTLSKRHLLDGVSPFVVMFHYTSASFPMFTCGHAMGGDGAVLSLSWLSVQEIGLGVVS
jgi:hypothetical protein